MKTNRKAVYLNWKNNGSIAEEKPTFFYGGFVVRPLNIFRSCHAWFEAEGRYFETLL